MKQILYLVILCFVGLGAFAQTEPRLVLPIGHTDHVNSAVFSPDGKYVLTSSSDRTSRIYEVASGQEVHVLSGHTEVVGSALFSPDGKFVLTASGDRTARIYEATSGMVVHVLSRHTDAVKSAVFSPDGKYALTASFDKTARIWDASSGQEVHVLSGHTDDVLSAVFSPDGKYALTASGDATARIFEVSSGKELQVLSGHTEYVRSAVFSPDGKYVLTASYDKTARIWEVSSGKEVHVLSRHTDDVNSAAEHSPVDAVFSPDGRYVLTVENYFDDSIRIYDVSSGKESQVLSGHTDWVNSAVFSPDGKYTLTASSDDTARIFEVASGKELQLLTGHTSSVYSAVFSPDGKYALTASEDNARIFEVSSGKELHVLSGYTDTVNSAVFSSDGKYALTASGDTTARIYEVSSGKEFNVLTGHKRKVKSADFSPDGKYALTASYDDTARIFEVSSGKESRVLLGHTKWVNSAVFSPDGKYALTAGGDKTTRIYDVSSGRQLQVLSWHTYEVTSAKFSPDGKYVLTASHDNTARIWDVSSGSQLQVFSGHTWELNSAVFSSDGNHVLTASGDFTARIFEVSSGQEVHVLSGHTSSVNSAVFSPDGKYALTASEDNARIFEVSSGKELQVLSGHTGWVNSAVFSPDGKHILTTSEDHKTILWDAATGNALYTRLQLKGNDWLVYDEHYRFDGTPGAIEKLYFVCGLEPIELGQMKDALYVPGLAGKILNGEDINYKKLSDLDICGALPIIEKINESPDGWEFSIEQRRWPIVRLEVMVDGKTVKTIAPDQLKFVYAKATLRLTRTDLQQHLKLGEENRVSVIAITENDKREFKSRGVQIELEAEGEKQDPNLYMLMIGVNDYKDDALDLRFPVQDARAFGSALESSARKLLGNDKVFVYNVQSKTDNTAVYTTPERAGVMKALEDIGKKAKTNDVLFIFFAGHGVMQGADNTFTFLTADASKLNPVGISTTDLKSWLSPEGPFHMMPNKTVLVYDACNSGQAAKEIMADLAMARDDDATERQRQIEDLGDKQGVFILSASAPNQSAYELPHLGQGMLTYSLLTALKNNPGVLDEDKNGNGFLNLQKWFLETEREQSRLMQSLGLNQDAQPYGTANIRIGLVDDEVRNGIALMAEKPLVYCSNARDDNDEDPLELKQAVNTYLETATTRGTSSKLGYIKAETTQANIVKLVYNTSGDKVQCRILIFKNKVKINELNITTTAGKAPEDVVGAVEGAIK
jgi:WD40 repeat protein/uncharacterized caspase-like protein